MSTTTDDTTTTTGSSVADPFDGCLRAVEAALDAAVDAEAWMLSEPALDARLTQTLRVRARVEELAARLLCSVEDREIPRVAGASSTRAWLMASRGLSVHDAARLVREAHVQQGRGTLGGSRSIVTQAGWAAGEISAEQAVLIGQTIDRLSHRVPSTAAAALQSDLIGHAQTLSYTQLRHVCRHAVEVVDPHGADADLAERLDAEERRALNQCELIFRRTGDGSTRFSGRLPDAQADLWRKALDAYSSPRHRPAGPTPDPQTGARPDLRGPGCSLPDTASRDQTSGGKSTPDPARGVDGADRRLLDYPHRLGRAFSELLEHLPLDGLPQHGANNVTFVVTTTLDQLATGLGETVLDTDTPMSPGQVRRLACNARIVPAVLDGTSAVLDLGMSQRLYDRHQRLALAVRDGGCIWPGCDRPPTWCEAHHIVAWSSGGPTDLANGCLLCPFHHHLTHGNQGWQIKTAPDGVPEIIPPPRIDQKRQPRRHQRLTHHVLC